jgi:hypothetical protein
MCGKRGTGMRLSGLILALFMSASAVNADDDMPIMTVGYYLHAFGAKNSIEQLQVVSYLSGIRDHIYWQCKYKVTVRNLIDASNLMIAASRTTYHNAEFVEWANKTPYGDMVFVGIKANPPNGTMKCS